MAAPMMRMATKEKVFVGDGERKRRRIGVGRDDEAELVKSGKTVGMDAERGTESASGNRALGGRVRGGTYETQDGSHEVRAVRLSTKTSSDKVEKSPGPGGSSNEADDEARESPSPDESSGDAAHDNRSSTQERLDRAPPAGDSMGLRALKGHPNAQTKLRASASEAELALAVVQDDHFSKALLRRSGPILNEFPELARFFRQEKRNERGACIHECAVCYYATLNKTTLLYHVVGKHLDIKPFLCTQGCGAERGSYSNMRQHELREHQVPYYVRERADKTPNYFVCSGCNEKFHLPLDLLQHFLRHHMPEKPWTYKRGSLNRFTGSSPVQLNENDEVQRRCRVKKLMSIENLTEPSNDERS